MPLSPRVPAHGNPLITLLHTVATGIAGLETFVGMGTSTVASLPVAIGDAVASELFSGAGAWVGSAATYLLRQIGAVMSLSTSPQLGTSFFAHEIGVMALLAAGIAVPLLMLSAVQAVIQQDAGVLLRALVVRVPLALALTGVAVQLVSLGLAATDDMCSAMLHSAGVPVGQLFSRLATTILKVTKFTPAIPTFVGLVMALAIVAGSLVLWLELALRAAAIQAATLFLPLAMAGAIWPATSRWARRLGETLAALVMTKLVVVAVLALAAGDLSGPGSGGIAAVVSGIALLMMAVLAPFALFRLVPMIEAGAVGHLEGLARRQPRAMYSAARRSLDSSDGARHLKAAQKQIRKAGMSMANWAANGGEGSMTLVGHPDKVSVDAVKANMAPMGHDMFPVDRSPDGVDGMPAPGEPSAGRATWPPPTAPAASNGAATVTGASGASGAARAAGAAVSDVVTGAGSAAGRPQVFDQDAPASSTGVAYPDVAAPAATTRSAQSPRGSWPPATSPGQPIVVVSDPPRVRGARNRATPAAPEVRPAPPAGTGLGDPDAG